jgi:hypothetical protein
MVSVIGIHKRKNLGLKHISKQEMSGNKSKWAVAQLAVHAVQIARGTKATAVNAKMPAMLSGCARGES